MKYNIVVLSVALWLPVCMNACMREGDGGRLVKTIAERLNTQRENIAIARGLRMSWLDNSEMVLMGWVTSPVQIEKEGKLYQSQVDITFLAKEKAGALDPNFGAVQTAENLATLFVVVNGILRWETPYDVSHYLSRDMARMFFLNVCYAKKNGGCLWTGYAFNEDGQYIPTSNTCYDSEAHSSSYWDQFRLEQ
jgi:hypothetical protein